MASSSKPTGVHYALVVFVLLTIVCGLGWLLAYKGSGSIGELTNENNKLKEAARAADTTSKQKLEELDRIKKMLGALYEQIGDENTPNTVLYDMNLHIKQYGGGVAQPTYNDTIVKLAEAMRNMTQTRDQLQEALAREKSLFEQQTGELNAQLLAERSARDNADKSKVDADNIHSEELKKKQDDIETQRAALAQLQQEYAEFKDSAEKLEKQLTQRVERLQAFNTKLTQELEQKTRVSYEVEDGHIIWIDSVQRRVWIDLGEVDGLRPRTTFSVYKKSHLGVGRGARQFEVGPEDIKGAIEVTRIMGPHQAEARILDEVIFDPIGKGDPIYSPLWSPGRGEAVSVIGIMDLDGDGKSDRDLLHDFIKASGGSIDNEVDDMGVLFVNGKVPEEEPDMPMLSEKTKFLVKGKIPDVGSTADLDQREIINRINKIQKEMDQQARERGIRVISLSDFLSFMGYKTQRRLFVPGGDTPYTMKHGARTPSTEASTGSRSPTGNTSALYSKDKDKTRRSSKSFRQGVE